MAGHHPSMKTSHHFHRRCLPQQRKTKHKVWQWLRLTIFLYTDTTIPEIQARWFTAINMRLTEDKITAIRIQWDKSFTSLVPSTWEPILSQDSDVPSHSNWLSNFGVLVGTRMLRPRVLSPTLSLHQGVCVK